MIADHCLGTVLHFMELIVRNLIFSDCFTIVNGHFVLVNHYTVPRQLKVNIKGI